jgi:hypothetical protein
MEATKKYWMDRIELLLAHFQPGQARMQRIRSPEA